MMTFCMNDPNFWKNIKFSEMVDRRNINFHPKEFSNSSQGPLGPRDEILNSEGWKFIFLRSTASENFIIINLLNNNIQLFFVFMWNRIYNINLVSNLYCYRALCYEFWIYNIKLGSNTNFQGFLCYKFNFTIFFENLYFQWS